MYLITNIAKTKNEKQIKSNLFCSKKNYFFQILHVEKFSSLSFSSKQKALKEFKAQPEVFNPNDKDQKKT